jgi:SAM-dependent methyltransferase
MHAETWTQGYVSDVAYTFGYYAELNPLRGRLPLLARGLTPGHVETACELGFGQGLSVNIHAAASGVEWYGTDFNPAQAAFAQGLAEVTGASVRLYDEAFEAFCHRTDLPDFDFIGLHGIWSWISPDNRTTLVDFLRRKLKPGGLLYVSYNTMPGWAAFAPLRRLLAEHADVVGSRGEGSAARIDHALDFADQLFAADPAFGRANPHVATRLKGLRPQSRNYLAHEFFNQDWRPMSYGDVAAELSTAKLSFSASAIYLDHVEVLNLTADQQVLLAGISDPNFRQSVRDFMVNQQFRRDYWQKGLQPLSQRAAAAALREESFVLAAARQDVSLKVTGALGEAALTEAVYAPILDLLAKATPTSVGDIESALASQGIEWPQIIEALLVLGSGRDVAPAQSAACTAASRPRTDRLNAALRKRAYDNSDVQFLASPVTGGGVALTRFEQLFLDAHLQGRTGPDAAADFAWEILQSQGQLILKDGAPLQTPAENLAELRRQATVFDAGPLAALQVVAIA